MIRPFVRSFARSFAHACTHACTHASAPAPVRRSARTALLAATTLTACVSSTTDPGPTTGDTVDQRVTTVEGELRSYTVHVPEQAPDSGAALMLVFHGAGSNGQSMLFGTDLSRISRDRGMVAVYADAGQPNWAEGCDCVAADRNHGVQDTALVTLMIADMVENERVDPAKVWAVGFSQGGMFAQRLACQMPGRFVGVAVVAATMSVQLAESCDPARAVDLLMLLSTVDPIFPWEGAPEGNFGTISALEMFDDWAARNGCADGERDGPVDGDGFVRYTASECPQGARVELMGVEGGAHAWIMSPLVDTTEELLRFFPG